MTEMLEAKRKLWREQKADERRVAPKRSGSVRYCPCGTKLNGYNECDGKRVLCYRCHTKKIDAEFEALLEEERKKKEAKEYSYLPGLRAIRKGAGVTQKQLAKACRVHQCYISALEHGKSKSSPTKQRRLARALGVSASELRGES